MGLKKLSTSKGNKKSLHLALILFILLWFSNEFIQDSIPFIFLLFVYVCWFIISIFNSKEFLADIVNNSIFIIFWTAAIIIRSILGGVGFSYELIYSVTLLMIYYIFLYYKKKDPTCQKIIFITLSISYLASAVYTAYYLNINPNLVRLAGAGLTSHEYYISQFGNGIKFIGSWDFIYSIVGVVLVFWYVASFTNNKFISISFKFCSLLFVYVIINASLSTAVILLFLIIYIYFMPNKFISKILYTTITIAVLIFFLFAAELILNYALDHIDNSAYIYKINESLKLLNGEYRNFNQFYGRVDLIGYSFNTIMSYPIFGVYGMLPYEYTSQPTIVSGHSQWVDNIARYGLFFSLFFIIGSVSILKSIINFSKDKFHIRLTKIIILYIFILGFLNPVLFNHLYLLLFIIVPFSYSLKEAKT